ncbi:MAG: response regulator transcription factor [Spirochaetales bacterium]|nr:response regulator transcription factor [Spirochaetales bacterium]
MLKKKILIVDDEPINLEFFGVMLSKLGFKVEQATNGEEALDKLSDCNPDLIILDNVMPKLSGWEVTKKIKNDKQFVKFKNIPIIMFSALDGVRDKIEGLELGVDDYITKPFNFSEVLARIKAVLRNRELANQISRRDNRIAVIESLNKTLIFSTQHIRKPVSELLEAAKKVDSSDQKAMTDLVELVKKEGQEILSSLEVLEEKIDELQSKGNELKKGDLSLEDLEKKFQEHFSKLETGN